MPKIRVEIVVPEKDGPKKMAILSALKALEVAAKMKEVATAYENRPK